MDSCRYCGESIIAGENWYKSLADKNHKACNSCCLKRNSENRHADKLKNPAKHILKNALERAKSQGVPFELSEEDIHIPEECPVLGIPLRFNKGHFRDDSPSLDKFVPELGYVRGNIAVISHKANVMKSNATLAEVKALYHWMSQAA